MKSFRNSRGAKLADQSCDSTGCGGKLEIIGGSHTLSGKHPFHSSETYTSDYYEGEYYYAQANRKGELFVFHDGFYHPVLNPVYATKR
jgi:hypothetical protein